MGSEIFRRSVFGDLQSRNARCDEHHAGLRLRAKNRQHELCQGLSRGKIRFFYFSRSLCNFIMTLDVSSTFRHILIAKYNITFWPNSVFLKTLKFRYFNSLLREFLGNSHKSGVEFGIATGTLGTGIIIFFLWFILFYFSEILRFFCVAYRLGRDAQERLDDRVRKDQFGWLFFFIF